MKIEITICRRPDAPDDPIVAAAGQPQEKIVCGTTLRCPGIYIGSHGRGRTLGGAFRVALANVIRDLSTWYAEDWPIVEDLDVEVPVAVAVESV